jgi:hypothetical protein
MANVTETTTKPKKGTTAFEARAENIDDGPRVSFDEAEFASAVPPRGRRCVVRRADEKAEVLENLREGVVLDVERALLVLQRELAAAEASKDKGSAKPLRTCARRLRSAWNLLDCLRLEIGGIPSELGSREGEVAQ